MVSGACAQPNQRRKLSGLMPGSKNSWRPPTPSRFWGAAGSVRKPLSDLSSNWRCGGALGFRPEHDPRIRGRSGNLRVRIRTSATGIELHAGWIAGVIEAAFRTGGISFGRILARSKFNITRVGPNAISTASSGQNAVTLFAETEDPA